MSAKEDPRMALINAVKGKKKKKDKIGSAEAAIGNLRYLLRLLLKGDLVVGGNMAMDQRLPPCLSRFAEEIIRTDIGVPFRPALRKLVQEWLDDEGVAREWMDYLDNNEDDTDPYVQSILQPLLKTLIGEPIGEKSETAEEYVSEDKA